MGILSYSPQTHSSPESGLTFRIVSKNDFRVLTGCQEMPLLCLDQAFTVKQQNQVWVDALIMVSHRVNGGRVIKPKNGFSSIPRSLPFNENQLPG